MAVNVTGGDLHFRATLGTDQFLQGANQIESRVSGMTNTIQNQGRSLESFAKSAAAAAASYLSIQAATGFVQQIIAVRGEFQQLDVAFTTILKSKAKADVLTAEMIQLAATTPFSLREVATSGKQLLAYGFAANEVSDTLKSLGNVAAGVSAPIGDIAYLYGTLRTQGRAYTRDIMQFTSRGIPIIAELAKQFGVAESQVMKMVETGKVGFPDIEKAFKGMTTSGGIFFNLMEQQSKTLTGRISNLGDAFDMMLNKIGEGNEGILNSGIDGALFLVQNYEKVLEIIGALIITYGAYRAALIAENVLRGIAIARTGALSTSYILLAGAEATAAAAGRVLNAVMAASPVAAFTAVIAALSFAMYALSQATTAAEVAQKQLLDISSEATGKVASESEKIKVLVSVLKDKTKSHEDQSLALKRLIAINPTYLEGLTLQNATTKKGTDLIDNYLLKLEEKAEGELAYAQKQKNTARIIELQTKGIDAVGTFERAGSGIRTLFDAMDRGNYSKVTTNSKDESARVVKEEVDKLVEASKQIDKQFGEKIKNSILNKDSNEAVINPSVIVDPKSVKKYKELLEERKELERSLFEGLAESRRNALTAEDKEFKEIDGKYDEQLRIVTEKNKQLKEADKISAKPIEDARTIDLALLGEKIAIKSYETELAAKKELFEQFEETKAKIGIDAANKQFKSQLGGFESFLDFLDADIKKRDGDLSRLATAKNLITKPIKVEAEKSKADEYRNLLSEFSTYQEKRQLLAQKYIDIAAELDKKGETDKANEARKAGVIAIIEVDDANIQQLESYKKLTDETIKLSKKKTLELINELEKEITLREAAGTITEDAAKKTRAVIVKTKAAIKDGIANNLFDAANALGFIGQEISGIDENFGSLLSTVGRVVAGFGEIQKQKAAYDKAKSTNDKFGQVLAGAGIVGAAIGAISSVVGYFKGLKEAKEKAKKEVSDFYNNAAEGESNYQALLRERARKNAANHKENMAALREEQSLILNQGVDIKKEADSLLKKLQGQEFVESTEYKRGNWFKKSKTIENMGSLSGKSFNDIEQLYSQGKLTEGAKSLFEQLKKLKEEGIDAEEALRDLAKQAAELGTGTNIDSLADQIIQDLKDGKNELTDTMADYSDIMQNALLSVFESDVVKQELQGFYARLTEAAKSDAIITAQEKQVLEADYIATRERIKLAADSYRSVTGVDFSDSTKIKEGGSALTGAIKGITEVQADLLSGQFNGLRLTGIQQLNVAMQSYEAHLKIEVNTRLTADHLNGIIPAINKLNDTMGKNAGVGPANGRAGG